MVQYLEVLRIEFVDFINKNKNFLLIFQSSAPSIPQHSQFSHPHSHPAVLHNASLSDLGAAGQPHYGPNLGSAVASSMHLTNSSPETDGGASGYKMDPDILYYSNASSEINSTTDGFLNSILNDEDLQLMDIGINEGEFQFLILYPLYIFLPSFWAFCWRLLHVEIFFWASHMPSFLFFLPFCLTSLIFAFN